MGKFGEYEDFAKSAFMDSPPSPSPTPLPLQKKQTQVVPWHKMFKIFS